MILKRMLTNRCSWYPARPSWLRETSRKERQKHRGSSQKESTRHRTRPPSWTEPSRSNEQTKIISNLSIWMVCILWIELQKHLKSIKINSLGSLFRLAKEENQDHLSLAVLVDQAALVVASAVASKLVASADSTRISKSLKNNKILPILLITKYQQAKIKLQQTKRTSRSRKRRIWRKTITKSTQIPAKRQSSKRKRKWLKQTKRSTSAASLGLHNNRYKKRKSTMTLIENRISMSEAARSNLRFHRLHRTWQRCKL